MDLEQKQEEIIRHRLFALRLQDNRACAALQTSNAMMMSRAASPLRVKKPRRSWPLRPIPSTLDMPVESSAFAGCRL